MIGMCSMVRTKDRLTVRTSAGLRVRPYRCKDGWRFYPVTPLTARKCWVAAVAHVYRWVSHGRGRRRTRSLEPWTTCSIIMPDDGRSFVVFCWDQKTGMCLDPKKIDRLDVQFGNHGAPL